MKPLIFFFFPLSLLFSDFPFEIGEKLHYKGSFKGINAAQCALEVLKKEKINNIMTYHVQFIAKSIGITNFLFPINDKIDIWLSEDSLFTVRIIENIQEGNYKYSSEINLYPEYGFAVTNKDTFLVNEKVHSPYALFYFFRSKNLMDLKGQNIKTIQNKKIIPLDILIEENIEVSVGAGKFQCTKIEPVKKNKKKFKNNGEISILFSNDQNRYPVKIWLKLKYGSLILELEKIIN